jgi:hypothetical protein
MSGSQWELDFKKMCEDRGILVHKTSIHCKFDFYCNWIRVQCKSLNTLEQHSRNSFALRVSRGTGCSASNNYKEDDFDVFAIRHGEEVMIVPVETVGFLNGRIKRRLCIKKAMKHKDDWKILIEGKKYSPEISMQKTFSFQD